MTLAGLSRDGSGGVTNALLVGSEGGGRPGGIVTGPPDRETGKAERRDVILVVHVDPGKTHAAVLSIPPDLYVPIDGTGGSDRISRALAVGGPQALLRTVQSSLGIRVDHYVQADFVGLERLVDAVGGVRIYLPNPARDFGSGLNLPTAGCVRLGGGQALAWVQSQDYEYLSNGKWTIDPGGEGARLARQQDLARRVIRKAAGANLSNPLTLDRLVRIGAANLTLDSAMSTGDIAALARRFRSADPDSVETATLASRAQVIDGKEVLVPAEPEARADVDWIDGRIAERPTPTVPSTSASTTTTRTAPGSSTTGPGRRSTAGAAASTTVRSSRSSTTHPSASTTITTITTVPTPTTVPVDAAPRQSCP